MSRFSFKTLLFVIAASVLAIFFAVRFAPPMQSAPTVQIQAGIDTDDANDILKFAKSAVQQRESWDFNDSFILIGRIEGVWRVNIHSRPLTPGNGLSLTFEDDGKLIHYLHTP